MRSQTDRFRQGHQHVQADAPLTAFDGSEVGPVQVSGLRSVIDRKPLGFAGGSDPFANDFAKWRGGTLFPRHLFSVLQLGRYT